MGDSYTPGLTVTRSITVRKTRRLPLPGTVLVGVGAKVGARDVVARADLPGRVHIVNLATQLGVMPDELAPQLRVADGAPVANGQVVAENESFFGLFRLADGGPDRQTARVSLVGHPAGRVSARLPVPAPAVSPYSICNRASEELPQSIGRSMFVN